MLNALDVDAGLLDSMLDQKLDQMLMLLQDSGLSPQPSPRTSFSPTSPSQQPTVRKAQKVCVPFINCTNVH